MNRALESFIHGRAIRILEAWKVLFYLSSFAREKSFQAPLLSTALVSLQVICDFNFKYSCDKMKRRLT